MPRRTRSQNLTQNQPSKSQNQAPVSDPTQRPGKEKVPEHIEINLAQAASRQAQLEGMTEETNQAVHTIKELLERMVLPRTQKASRPGPVREGAKVEQQVAKTTTCGNATSNRRANSQQVTRSRADSTQSVTADKERRDEVGPSRPQSRTASGRPMRPGVITRSPERGVKEDPNRPSRNAFDRLGQD